MKRIIGLALTLTMLAAAACTGFAAASEAAPDDPLYGEQWYLNAINAPFLWENGITGDGVRIAVLDSGISQDQEDFDYSRIEAGHNYLGGYYYGSEYIDENNLKDILGHGTSVSSIISARRNNGVGMTGMLDKATIVPLEIVGTGVVINDSTHGVHMAESIAQAIRDAADVYHCDVINMSPGSLAYSDEEKTILQDAINYAASKNVIIVTAVGNTGSESANLIAGFDNVIGVGAVDQNGKAADFSAHGSSVFVTAPGVGIYSATNEGSDTYKSQNGTSLSCPMVAALAGAAKYIDRDLTADEFRSLLKTTSKDAGETGYDEYYGWGIIDCRALISSLLETTGTTGFYDMTNHWAKENVKFVTDRRLFDGISEHSFAPDGEMTRAMLVTVLGRLYESAGNSISVAESSDFTDVSPTDWYAKYVMWASENGLVQGYGDGRFGPNDNVTREQLASILSRYAKFSGQDVTASAAKLSVFSDADDISSWADGPMSWAVENGLINGSESGGKTYLSPRSSATRAQVAAIIERYCEK